MSLLRRASAAFLLLPVVVTLSHAEEPILGKTRDEWIDTLHKGKTPRMRKAAALALGIYGPARKEVLPELLKALGNEKEEDVRLQVVTTLGEVRPREQLRDALGTLADALKDDKSAAVRAKAAELIGELGDKARPALGTLVAALKDADAGVRAACAEAIGKMGPEAAPDAVNPMLPLLKDEDATVRLAAVYAFGRIGPDASFVVPDILQVLEKDKDDNLRREAVRSLALMGTGNSKLVLPAALKALDSDPSAEVRREVAVKLPKFGNLKPIGKELVERLQADRDRGVRLYLARSIPAGSGEGFKELLKDYADLLAKEPEPDVRFAMVQEIGALGTGGKEALEALTAAQSDVVLQVREAAREAVQQVKGVAKKDPAKK